MKTREKLAYMALGGVLVIAGMILGQFMFGSVYAQKNTSVSSKNPFVGLTLDIGEDYADLERPHADFGTIRCKTLIVGDDVNPIAVRISSVDGNGLIETYNRKKGQTSAFVPGDNGAGYFYIFDGSEHFGLLKDSTRRITLTGTDKGAGLIRVYNDSGVCTSALGHLDTGGGVLSVFNSKGTRILYAGSTIDDDGLLGLYDRYGDVGWVQTGKVR